MAREQRKIEPWPIALAAALAGMIGVCLAFWFVAATHPDPDLPVEAKPGLAAPGAAVERER